MRGRIVAGLFLCSLFFVVGGDAQSPDIPEKPVWTLEFITVQPENLAPAMQYLNDHWMRGRAEAKRRGAVLDYHLMSNAGSSRPQALGDSIVLVTKYKNMDAFMGSQKRFPLMPGPDGNFKVGPNELLSVEDDFLEMLTGQVFVEEPERAPGSSF